MDPAVRTAAAPAAPGLEVTAVVPEVRMGGVPVAAEETVSKSLDGGGASRTGGSRTAESAPTSNS